MAELPSRIGVDVMREEIGFAINKVEQRPYPWQEVMAILRDVESRIIEEARIYGDEDDDT